MLHNWNVIAEIETKDYVAYVAVGGGLRLVCSGKLKKVWQELEKAIPIEPEEWDAYFWKGILCAYYYRDGSDRVGLIHQLEQAPSQDA